MEKLKMSLIMPVYNSERYLEKTIQSVLNQSLEEFEFIIIDDGSTDNSLNILKKYSNLDERIKLIIQKNSGVSKSRNRGIDFAKGEYIGFIDADDILESNFLKVLYSKAKKNDSDIAMTGYSIFYEKLSIEKSRFIEYKLDFSKMNKNNWFKNMLYCGLGVNIWTKIYRREMINKYSIRFLEGITYDEDMFFSWKCVLAANKIIFDNNKRYFYRLESNSATMRYHKNIYEKYLASFEDLKEFATKNNFYNSEFENLLKCNFVSKLPVIFRMTIREKSSIKEKEEYILKILENKLLIDGINIKLQNGEICNPNDRFLKNILNKKIKLLLLESYFIDLKIRLARKIKKYI